ncbi:MAG: hypothetical protein ACREVY_04185 [Gammaproteobacteria bacterium]
MSRHDFYFAAWAIVLPITSILLLPSVQGTTPGYLFALAVICPPISVLVIPKDMLLRFYYDLILFVMLYAALNAIAQLSLSFSQTVQFPLNLPLIDSDTDRRILMRKPMFTQSLYVLAAASTFFFVKHLYSVRWDKYLFTGAIVFALYGIYEWVYFLVFGDSGDFLSNRTFDSGNLFGDVHTGSWFQTIHLGPLTVQRLKSLAGEPSMYAFAILPFWIYALHTNRTFTHMLLFITLLLSTSTTAMLGIFVYFIVRLCYFGPADKIVFVSLIVLVTVLAMGLSGNAIVLDVYAQIVENKLTLQSASGANRYDSFLNTTDFFLNGSLLTQVFGIGNGYVRSTDFFSTILVNLGVVGLIMTTWIFVYPVLKLGNTEAEVGLKAAVLTVFITLMVAVPHYTSLPLSLFLGIAYSYISNSRSLLSSVSRRPEIQAF